MFGKMTVRIRGGPLDGLDVLTVSTLYGSDAVNSKRFAFEHLMRAVWYRVVLYVNAVIYTQVLMANNLILM